MTIQQRDLLDATSYLPSGRRAPPSLADRPFVEKMRALGANWDAIGAMLDRPTPDVRAAFDPTYVPLHKAALPGFGEDGE